MGDIDHKGESTNDGYYSSTMDGSGGLLNLKNKRHGGGLSNNSEDQAYMPNSDEGMVQGHPGHGGIGMGPNKDYIPEGKFFSNELL